MGDSDVDIGTHAEMRERQKAMLNSAKPVPLRTVFHPCEPSMLKSLTTKDINLFVAEFKKYDQQIKDNERAGGNDIPRRSLTSFIEPSLLNMIAKFC